MATGEIKPCPFCGGEGKFYMFNGESVEDGHRRIVMVREVQCTVCGAVGPANFSSREKAIEDWNRREDRAWEKCRKCWEDPDGGEVFGSGVNEDCPWYGEPDGCNNRRLRAEAFARFEKEEEAKNGK